MYVVESKKEDWYHEPVYCLPIYKHSTMPPTLNMDSFVQAITQIPPKAHIVALFVVCFNRKKSGKLGKLGKKDIKTNI
jgi:hypothetical protein